MHQAAEIISDRLWLGHKPEKTSDIAEACLKSIHDALALELGRDYLSDRFWFYKYNFNGNPQTTTYTNNYTTICKKFLESVPPDMQNADAFIKERLSLVELAFRHRQTMLQAENLKLPFAIREAEAKDRSPPPARGIRLPGSRADAVRTLNQKKNDLFAAQCDELNERMRLAQYPLTYHNGMIQFASDTEVTKQIEQPFWSMVSNPIWKNVDEQMKEAIDRRDRSDRTAAFHAVCALESTIKIISTQKNWTTGNEKGAANYIDNLVSKNNGRFIEPWEGDMLKTMFSDVRNPFAHGPGQEPMPKLSDEQTDWAIDTAMSWIKSLVRRM